jgi:histidine ammonia-lyase
VAGEAVAVAPGLLAAVRQHCEQARRALHGQPVYASAPAWGALSSVRLTEQQLRYHQRNLLLARATAGGPGYERDRCRGDRSGPAADLPHR